MGSRRSTGQAACDGGLSRECCWPLRPVCAPRSTPRRSISSRRKCGPVLVEHCYRLPFRREQVISRAACGSDSRDGLLKGGDLGPAIVPGDPDKSRLIEADPLQESRPANAAQTRAVHGADRGADKVGRHGRARSAQGPTETRRQAAGHERGGRPEFLGLQAVRHSGRPGIENPKAKIENPIDAFHQARLAEAGLSPAPPAANADPDSPRDLRPARAARRHRKRSKPFWRTNRPRLSGAWSIACSARRTTAFAGAGIGSMSRATPIPTAAMKISPSETPGATATYVVESFNNDKPFDRFLIEQIAGDLLPDANQETRTATGFLQLGAKVLAEGDKEKLVMDTIDEQIDTMGKAFLGLTLGCARCHTHKFDPIMHDDYYALAAIFKSSKTFADGGRGAIKYWYEHSFATRRGERKDQGGRKGDRQTQGRRRRASRARRPPESGASPGRRPWTISSPRRSSARARRWRRWR